MATVLYEEDPWTVELLQLSGEHHLQLLTYLHDMAPETIICESFHNVGNEAARLHSSEIIGVVKVYSPSHRTCTVVWQSPATGKAFWTDARLKQCGLYVPGVQHARDATRHYAYWRMFTLNDKSILFGRGSANRSVTELDRPE